MTTDEMKENEVHKALQTIVDHRSEKAVNWAVNYARAGLSMSGRELHTQVLYILGNIQHWRGLAAKEVRNTLKAYVGIK